MEWRKEVWIGALLPFAGCGRPPLGTGMGDAGVALTKDALRDLPGVVQAARPSLAALTVGSSDGSTIECAAAFVHRSWLLTAAHCVIVSGQRTGAVTHAGAAGDPEVLPVERAVTHPTLDIALVRVESGAESLRPLSYAAIERSPGARTFSLIFGANRHDERRLVNEVVASVGATTMTALVATGAGADTGTSAGPCVGDSGAALIVDDGSGEPKIGGILSRGAISCRGPDEYVRADRVWDWVERTVGTPSAADPSWAAEARGARCGLGRVRWCEPFDGRRGRCDFSGVSVCQVGHLGSEECHPLPELGRATFRAQPAESISDAVFRCARAFAEAL